MVHRVKVHLQLVRAFLKSKTAFEKQLQQARCRGEIKAELHLLTLLDHVFGELQQQGISERPLPPRLWDSLETGLKTHQDDSWKHQRKHQAFRISELTVKLITRVQRITGNNNTQNDISSLAVCLSVCLSDAVNTAELAIKRNTASVRNFAFSLTAVNSHLVAHCSSVGCWALIYVLSLNVYDLVTIRAANCPSSFLAFTSKHFKLRWLLSNINVLLIHACYGTISMSIIKKLITHVHNRVDW